MPLVAEKLTELREWTGHHCPHPFPQTQPQTFPKRDRGLLVALGTQEGGLSVSGKGGRSNNLLFRKRQYNFYAEGAFGINLTFLSNGQGLRPTKRTVVKDETGESLTYDVAFFGPETPNDWGLSSEAHLVEIEINGGIGGFKYLTATDVRILDGTPEYPLSIIGSLNAARDLFDN